ncbi:hypothetical protein IX53_04435 [Kosmotoga pacifica]|uniref:Uncharacterized protein n=1 Tax=Kosmotoga pacifica TaxID=1330330 RepID=A0A0G2Z6F5_9BACT|nr:hypothetical protein IX53_04435 [Kosmotoga pacifica]
MIRTYEVFVYHKKRGFYFQLLRLQISNEFIERILLVPGDYYLIFMNLRGSYKTTQDSSALFSNKLHSKTYNTELEKAITNIWFSGTATKIHLIISAIHWH